MNKIRIIGILSSIIAIVLFSIGGVSGIEPVLIGLNYILIGINITTWRT